MTLTPAPIHFTAVVMALTVVAVVIAGIRHDRAPSESPAGQPARH